MIGLDDSLLTALGEITFSFSELESSLAFHTWLLIDPQRPRTGITITAGMDFNKVLEMFAALVIDRTDPDDNSTDAQEIRQRLKDLLLKVDAARADRNRIAHSRWCTTAILERVVGDDPSSSILRLKQSKDRKKGWQMQFEVWKLEQLRTVLGNIEIAQHELTAFVDFANRSRGLFPANEAYSSIASKEGKQ